MKSLKLVETELIHFRKSQEKPRNAMHGFCHSFLASPQQRHTKHALNVTLQTKKKSEMYLKIFIFKLNLPVGLRATKKGIRGGVGG